MTWNRLSILAVSTLLATTLNASADSSAYTFDPMHTEVRFCWNHLRISRQCAHFTGYDGELLYDEASPEKSQLKVTFKTDSIETLVPIFNDHMKGDKLFDTKKFPEATFTSTKFDRTGEKTGKVSGDLTLRRYEAGYARRHAEFCGHSADVQEANSRDRSNNECQTHRIRYFGGRSLCVG